MSTDSTPKTPAAAPAPKKKVRREDALEYHSRGRKG